MKTMNKQDILVRMSIDPLWTIDDKNSPLIKVAEYNGFQEALQINNDSLVAEKVGRWKQILKMIEPIFKKTIKELRKLDKKDGFINNKYFQGYLSSDFLWDVECSLEHPAGFGKGSEKGTSFYMYIKSNNEIPDYVKDLSNLEYKIFKALYVPSNVTDINLSNTIYLSKNVSLIKSDFDVLNIIEKDGSAEKGNWYYVVNTKAKVYRINEDTFEKLKSFKKGKRISNNDSREIQLAIQAKNIAILTNDKNVIDKSMLDKFFGIKS